MSVSVAQRGQLVRIATPIYSADVTPFGLASIRLHNVPAYSLFAIGIRPVETLDHPSAFAPPMEAPTLSDGIIRTRFAFKNIFGEFTIEPRNEHLLLSYVADAISDKTNFCPMCFHLFEQMGSLLLPNNDLPFNLSDRKAAGTKRDLPANEPVQWSLNSQFGFLCEENCPDTARQFRACRLSEKEWNAGSYFENLYEGERISGSLKFQLIPFNGACNLHQVTQRLQRTKEVRDKCLSPSGSEAIQFTKPSCSRLEAKIDGIPITIAASVRQLHAGGTKWTFNASAFPINLGDEPAWQIDCFFQTEIGSSLEVRLDAYAETPCGNPSWDGDATVLIPGNFARTNYNPSCLHGGGPKYGPSPIPERENLTANDDAPGSCHGWTFASSRLPQVWTAAIDRHARKIVWMGAEPQSPCGENCAGFISPDGAKTILRLSTPTTYEPWVPLGYSRMREQSRRDCFLVPGGTELKWSFYFTARDTNDINAWAPLERALYLLKRPKEPSPVRMPHSDAAKICAEALFKRFYQPGRAALTYSTGPNGQNTLLGFTGMAHSALVMLWAGQEFHVPEWHEAGARVLDTVAEMFNEGPDFPFIAYPSESPAGGRKYATGSGEPGYIVMVAFDNLAEAYRRERAAGRDHSAWSDALRRCAEAWLNHQSPEGAYPHWGPAFGPEFTEYDYASTNIECGVIANMIDAFELFGDEKYLGSAKRAAAFYARHLDNAQLWGGPGDIRALVNSEVPMFFLRAFRRLYEISRDGDHKRLMLLAASWRYSFQFAHSWMCDYGSPLFKQGWSGLGSENASACNMHSVAFGSINIPDMWALWQITGDEYHRMRFEDLAQYSTQQYARYAGDLGFPFAGAGTESWWTTDSVWGKGHPWIFTDPGFDLGYMSWVTGWSGYGALAALEALGSKLI